VGYDFFVASIGLSLFFCILTGYTFGGFFALFLLPKTSQTRSNASSRFQAYRCHARKHIDDNQFVD
jgi:hypothetical protein